MPTLTDAGLKVLPDTPEPDQVPPVVPVNKVFRFNVPAHCARLVPVHAAVGEAVTTILLLCAAWQVPLPTV